MTSAAVEHLGIDDILSRLHDVRQRGPGEWMALCPAHDDVNPSLSVKEDGERVLVHCFAGCPYEAVMGKLGPGFRTNGDGRNVEKGRIVARNVYQDATGRDIFCKVRMVPKGFFIQHPNGRGRWEPGMGGVEPVLYRLPDLADKAGDWRPIYICEGEKDADRVVGLGLLATCNFDGAAGSGQQSKWRESYNPFLAGRVVYVLADNDEPGRAHAAAIAGSLRGVAKSVKVVELPGLAAGGDVSDWLDAGHTKEELEGVALMTGEWEPVMAPSVNGSGVHVNGNGAGPYEGKTGAVMSLRPSSLADLLAEEMRPLEWVVDGLVARGQLLMIAGRPKSGKTWLVLQLAQSVDEGRAFLGKDVAKGKVLLVTLEDGPRRLRSRAEMLGWRPSAVDVVFKLAYLDGDKVTNGPGMLQLYELAGGYDLIVIDTLIAGLSGRAEENNNPFMAAIANELAAMARAYNSVVVLVHHTSKGTHEDVFHTIRGAGSLRGAYDVGMVLERKKDEREGLLHVESKDIEGGSLTIRQGEGGAGWQLVGGAVELRKIRAGRQVVMTLMEHGDGVTAEDLAKTMGITRQAANQQLLAAEAQGLVRRKKPDVEQLQMIDGGPKKKADVWYLM